MCCGRWRRGLSGRCCCSVAARIRLCCCAWRRRRFARRAFPFPLMHVDTGENFPEAIEFRDRRVDELGERLIVASVQDSIDQGRVSRGNRPARVTQPPANHNPARRDRRRTASTARSAAPAATKNAPAPKNASSASATTSATGTPKTSAPNCGTSTTPASTPANTSASSPSPTGPNSTSGNTSKPKHLEVPSIYFAHTRQTFTRDGMLYAYRPGQPLLPGEHPTTNTVRYRTVGDMTCTGAIRSTATTITQILNEIATTRITERGQTRADDKTTDSAMEDRKKAGYF